MLPDSARRYTAGLSRRFGSRAHELKPAALVAALLLAPACTQPDRHADAAAELIGDAERLVEELEAHAAACKRDSSNCVEKSALSGSNDGGNSGQVSYFPDKLRETSVACDFGNGVKHIPAIGEIEDEWYERQLKAAQEPVLHTRTQGWLAGESVIRFTWLRTFHRPVFVRVEQVDGQAPRLTAKELSGAGGYDPGTIVRLVERSLSLREAERFLRLIERTDVLELPFECPLGTDGAQWLIEVVDSEGYHFIARWSPDKGPVYEVGTHLLRLTGWKFDEVY